MTSCFCIELASEPYDRMCRSGVGSSRGSIVVVIRRGIKASGFRIDCHFAGSMYLPLREMMTLDHPSVQFLPHLLQSDRVVPRNESGCGGLLRVRDHKARGCGE